MKQIINTEAQDRTWHYVMDIHAPEEVWYSMIAGWWSIKGWWSM